MKHSFRMKLLAGLFVPAVAVVAGTAYGMGTDKMKGDASANATATTPATPSATTNSGMSGTSGADATFARLDTNHDAQTLRALATLLVWTGVGALTLVVAIEAILVVIMMRAHGWARWGLLGALVVHAAVWVVVVISLLTR